MIYAYKDGELYKVFPSRTECIKETGVSAPILSRILAGTANSYKGFHFFTMPVKNISLFLSLRTAPYAEAAKLWNETI